MSEPVKEFTVLYLYDACRSVCKISERETAAALRARETTKRSATALAAPFVAVAAIAAFLDEVGPALGSDVAVLRDGQRKRVAANVLYGKCHAAWFKRPADEGVVANISLLNTVRNDLVHPDRVPAERTLAGLEARGVRLGEANWPRGLERRAFPSDLMWDEFAIWCYDVAADAARAMIRSYGTGEAWRVLARPFAPYRGTLVRGHPIRGPVARSGETGE